MVKYEDCKFTRDKSLTHSQALAIFLAVVSLGFGITCIVYTGKLMSARTTLKYG